MLKSLVCMFILAGALLATSLTANAQMDSAFKNNPYKHFALIFKHDVGVDFCRLYHDPFFCR